MDVLVSPENLREYAGIGAVGIMGLLCLLGMLLSSKQFNRLMDRHETERSKREDFAREERSEWKGSIEKMFEKQAVSVEKCTEVSTAAIHELHVSVQDNTKALNKVKCVKY